MQTLKYTNWYFANFPTNFIHVQHMEAITGERPSPLFSLTRVDVRKVRGADLTEDNFVWTTKAALAKAKEGIFDPPTFPVEPDGSHTRRQALNNERFYEFVRPSLEWARKRAATQDKRRQYESDLDVIMDNIRNYLQARGYGPEHTFDPDVLPPETYPKLNAARKHALYLMKCIGDPHYEKKHARLDDLRKRQQARREEARAELDEAVRTNRIYSGRPGRPMHKLVQIKKRISDLTAEERKAHGIPEGQDYRLINTPKRKNQKVWTVMVTAANPLLAA